MGHLGLTPQSVEGLGGHKVQGRTESAAEKIYQDAMALQEAGCFALVLECVPQNLGRQITRSLDIPTIGIGAGAHTDGQVLVLPRPVKRCGKFFSSRRQRRCFSKLRRGLSVRVLHCMGQWQQLRATLSGSVGFVPTMGALHDGHLSLLKESVRQNDATVLSIYVNATQFNDPNDLAKYPSTLEADLAAAQAAGADVVLLPDYPQMYADDFRFQLAF